MPTLAAVHTAVVTKIRNDIELALPVAVIYGNQDRPELSQGTAPFLKQRFTVEHTKQFELGRTGPCRHWGALNFLIHVQKGAGDGQRDVLQDAVIKSFRSVNVGGATFLNARTLPSGEVENWSLTGVVIPFYFDEM